MSKRCLPCALAVFLVAGSPVGVAAQTIEHESVRDALIHLMGTAVGGPIAAAVGFSTALEVANAPFGSSAGGFVFKTDPSTGLRVRTAPTFGPSFAERALTAGEGKVTFGVSLGVATYDKLNRFSLEEMRLGSLTNVRPLDTQTLFSSLVLSSETLVVSTSIGATDNLDLAVSVPFVKVKLDGTAWVVNGANQLSELVSAKISSAGLGDLAVSGKLRVARFGEEQPDPGGVALMLTTRLPTGNRENFRGLGITRVLGSALVSFGKGRLRPHGNVGFEWWEKNLSVPADVTGGNFRNARHQVQYAAGVEIGAGPKVTLLFDVVGRHTLGDGSVANQSFAIPPSLAAEGYTSIEFASATEQGIRKVTVVPGLKWNLKGNFVLSGNALMPVWDNGLRDYFTPVVGLDWTF